MSVTYKGVFSDKYAMSPSSYNEQPGLKAIRWLWAWREALPLHTTIQPPLTELWCASHCDRHGRDWKMNGTQSWSQEHTSGSNKLHNMDSIRWNRIYRERNPKHRRRGAGTLQKGEITLSGLKNWKRFHGGNGVWGRILTETKSLWWLNVFLCNGSVEECAPLSFHLFQILPRLHTWYNSSFGQERSQEAKYSNPMSLL